MKITMTVELSDEERLTVCRFLKLADKISDVTTSGNMVNVFEYFANQAEILANGEYNITALHQIGDIR